MAYVLINHGWTNVRAEDHWQRKLAVALRRQGHQVFYPQYPSTDAPSFADWSWLLARELEILLETRGDDSDEIIVIGHSLGNINLLKSAAAGILPADLSIDRLLIAAPPESKLLSELSDFSFELSDPALAGALHAVARSITLVGSDADPWCPSGIQAVFGDPLGVDAVIIPGGKHLSSKDGWGSWQGIIDWVSNPDSDLTKR